MYHMHEAIFLSYDDKIINKELMVHLCHVELP